LALLDDGELWKLFLGFKTGGIWAPWRELCTTLFFSDSFSVKGCCFSEPYTILKIFSFSPNPFPPCILTFPDLSGASHPHGTAVELSSRLAGQVEISFQRGRSDHFDHVTLKAASPVLGTLA
jgi:hypothetical protein